MLIFNTYAQIKANLQSLTALLSHSFHCFEMSVKYRSVWALLGQQKHQKNFSQSDELFENI